MRSIGYRSVAIDDSVPFDSQNGLVPNRNGRVVDSNNQVIKGTLTTLIHYTSI